MKLIAQKAIRSLFPKGRYQLTLKKSIATVARGNNKIFIISSDDKLLVLDKIDSQDFYKLNVPGIADLQDRVDYLTKPILEGDIGNSKILNEMLKYVRSVVPRSLHGWVSRQHAMVFDGPESDRDLLPIITVSGCAGSYHVKIDPIKRKFIINRNNDIISLSMRSEKELDLFNKVMARVSCALNES